MAILPRKISFLIFKRNRRKKGFTLIEVMIVVAIIAIMILIGIWAYRLQLLKGRDARRKADLAQWQKMLEDYINDNICYPPGLACGPIPSGGSFEGYLSEIPCDPINNTWYNYIYTYEQGVSCDKWYKIYTKLENEKDPIIAQVGCEGGCGPSNNYNYWVGSPNVTEVAQLPDEFWPDIPGVPGNGEPGPTDGEPGPTDGEPGPTDGEPGPTDGPLPPETDPLICWDSNYETYYCINHCAPGGKFYPGCCGSCCGGGLPGVGGYRCDKMDFEDRYDDKCILDPVCPP